MTQDIKECLLRVETSRFGPFTFQLGIEPIAVEALYLRVTDAFKRLQGSPLSHVANRLEKEVVVSSIFGTNSIEGGTLSEQETQLALELEPDKVQDVEQRRATNLKNAYDLSREAASDPKWCLDIDFINKVHTAITANIPHQYNQPARLRDNSKEIVTYVGDKAHGGRYKPPQYAGDIKLLLESLVKWNQEMKSTNIPALIRAPLIHFYYELIHPYWDGNGRVGRVLEATLLQADGFRYAPFAQARFYYEKIDKYFTLFNLCRKQADKKITYPNTPFFEFFLEGMLVSLNKLHDRVNSLVNLILFENDLKHKHDDKEINARQYAIVSQVLDAGRPIALSDLRRAPWYIALYTKRTEKTKQRDLRKLRDMELIAIDKKNRLWPGIVAPDENV